MSSYPSPTSGYTPRQTNGLGVAGFVTSLVGMVVCFGVICPVGAILSLCAVFRVPRGFAVAGLILGVFGSIMWTLLILMAFGVIGQGINWFNQMNGSWQTQDAMTYAAEDIDDYFDRNYALPDDATGRGIVRHHFDEWNNPVVYRKVDDYNFDIISTGPDGQLNTPDDQVNTQMAMANYYGYGSSANPWPDGTGGFAAAHAAIHLTYGGGQNSPPSSQVQHLLDYNHVDQWGNTIVYRAAAGREYRLTSAGPDGQWGTEDDVERRYSLAQTGPIDQPAPAINPTNPEPDGSP